MPAARRVDRDRAERALALRRDLGERRDAADRMAEALVRPLHDLSQPGRAGDDTPSEEDE